MKRNKTYQSLLIKSVHCMLSAIEIYNKPNIYYREESFAILAINSWELLTKAQLLKINSYNMGSIYAKQKKRKKDGEQGKRLEVKLNRSGNPQTISIIEAINRLKSKRMLTDNIVSNIESLIEFRDSSIHFTSNKKFQIELQELSYACVLNFIAIIKKWEIKVDLSKFNIQLLSLAFVTPNTSVKAALTSEEKNYRDFFLSCVNSQKTGDSEFSVAINIGVNFEKRKPDSIPVVQGKEGISISLTEEEFKGRYPLTYNKLRNKAKTLYSDLLFDRKFLNIIKDVKKNPKLYYERRLDPQNPKSLKQLYYSEGVWSIFDQHYARI